MSSPPKRILIFQTAFIGDVILTLPLAQILHQRFPGAHVAFVAIPAASAVLANHPAVDEVIEYDKRGMDRGLAGIRSVASRLREGSFDLALIPHRSIRSALIGWLSRTPRRIGFSTSSGRWLFTDTVSPTPGAHEIDRNLDLLKPIIPERIPAELPELHPNGMDEDVVTSILAEHARDMTGDAMIAVAPGSVWATKRWPKEYFVGLVELLITRGCSVALVGGPEDGTLCAEILQRVGNRGVISFAGKLSLLQSAALIRHCRVMVSNDSAPMHIAVARKVPTVGLFCATTPELGFYPYTNDAIVVQKNLFCRPCGSHGGRRCPLGTEDCIREISPDAVLQAVAKLLDRAQDAGDTAPVSFQPEFMTL